MRAPARHRPGGAAARSRRAPRGTRPGWRSARAALSLVSWQDVAVRARALAGEDAFAALGSCRVEAAGGRLGSQQASFPSPAHGRLGLREGVAARGTRVRRAEIRNPRGDLLTLLDYEALGWETYGILRSDLQQAMLEAVPGDPLRLGTTCIGATEDGEALLDGAEAVVADIVVGADGVRSAVRRSLFGEELLRYGGHRAWRAGTRFDDERTRDRFVEVWGVGGGFGFGPAGSGRVYWYCFEAVPEGAPAPERPRDEFLGRYGAWFDPIPALIESTEPDAIEPTFTYDRPPRRTWGRGRVTLLGDAAHPMKPNIGQGAAQALEDAVVLGSCIGPNRDPEEALREYERRRVKRANAVVRASRRAGRAAEGRSPLAARLRDIVEFRP